MSDTTDNDAAKRPRGPRSMAIAAVLFGCVLIAVLFVAGPRLREARRSPRVGVTAALPLDTATRAFRANGGNAELVALVKALYAAHERGEDTGDALARYGSLLLARAREGSIDLQKADPDEDLMAAILGEVRRAISEHPQAAEGDGKK